MVNPDFDFILLLSKPRVCGFSDLSMFNAKQAYSCNQIGNLSCISTDLITGKKQFFDNSTQEYYRYCYHPIMEKETDMEKKPVYIKLPKTTNHEDPRLEFIPGQLIRIADDTIEETETDKNNVTVFVSLSFDNRVRVIDRYWNLEDSIESIQAEVMELDGNLEYGDTETWDFAIPYLPEVRRKIKEIKTVSIHNSHSLYITYVDGGLNTIMYPTVEEFIDGYKELSKEIK